jgi:nicotinamide riboside kinase
MYKIAIIGSQSTGKSLIGKELSNRLNIPIITEIARRYDRNELLNVSSERYMILQKDILEQQIIAESQYKEFISDRSSLDNLSYWINNCANRANLYDNDLYIKKAIENAKIYSHIFLLIPEFYPKDDGFRSTDIIYQMRIDAIIQTILHLYGIKHYILTGSVDNRIKDAMKILIK